MCFRPQGYLPCLGHPPLLSSRMNLTPQVPFSRKPSRPSRPRPSQAILLCSGTLSSQSPCSSPLPLQDTLPGVQGQRRECTCPGIRGLQLWTPSSESLGHLNLSCWDWPRPSLGPYLGQGCGGVNSKNSEATPAWCSFVQGHGP